MSCIIKIFDCMCLSILWMLCCIPVITIGASTTALYHTMYHYIRKEKGSLLKTFQREILGKLYGIILILCAVFLTWIVYLTAYAARFHGTVLEVLRTSCVLMIVHPLKSILVFIVLIAGIYLSILYTGFLSITPAIICWGSSVIIERVFQCHMQP